MKIFISLAISLMLSCGVAWGDVTKTVGAIGADYSTLKAAFDAINAGTITGVITLQITDNTTEVASAVLNASGSGSASYSAVTIYPAGSGFTIGGNLSSPLIDLYGADGVTIDGRVNQTGAGNLIISNSATAATAGTSTIRFIEDATQNVIKYCYLKGSSTDASAGVVFLSTTSLTTGNDSNTIDNNHITCSSDANRPLNAICSAGTSGKENSGNIFSNNNIYDFLNRSTASNGINLASFTTGETISGNSFYETASFAPTASVAYSILKINNAAGTGFTVSGNYFGGSAASCSGTFSKTAAFDNVFYAINLNVGTTPATSVQNNTIQNIAWSNSGAASWTGIQITVGSVNVGTVTGNTIGASVGTGSITVTGGATGTNVYGINIAGSGTITIQNNTIGSITAANSATYASNIIGINRGNTGTNNFSNNTIGSTTEANSIRASSASTDNAQSVYGILNTTGGSITLNNNTIANLTNATTNTAAASAGLINGIASPSGSIAITNNTVRNLTIANANNSASNTASVCGIALTSTNALNTITGNSIYDLSNSYASFEGSVIGLYFGATGMYTTNSHTVTGNFIHSLSVNASSSAASLYGIRINTGQTIYANNIISVGGNTPATFYGIYETGTASNNNSLYFNTIYVYGEPTTGNLNSYALFSAASTNTRNFRNNIFFNARSNGGVSAKHYAAYFSYGVSTNLTLDFNDYYTIGTGGVLGYYNGADVILLPLITGLDAKSLKINPELATAGGTVAANYRPGSGKLEGTSVGAVTTDYSLANRASTPTIGAYETTLNLNVDVYKTGVFQSSFFRLKDAFDKINSGALTGALEIRIKASTTETASAVLYQSGYTAAGGISNYSSVTIYPTVTGLSVSGNFDASLIDLNGADNVILDGRLNRAGLTDLTITNSMVSTYASAIRFANSAENDIVSYCNVKSACSSAGVGVLYFASSASGNGNDNNIVEYCNITNAGGNRPVNVVFTSGGNGRENSGNIIRNNNIFDFLNAGSSSYGINISYNSTDWTISGNSFYETTLFAPTGPYSYNVIRANTGNNHIISNNYIGGKEPLCQGSAWTTSSNFTHYFCGFFINGGTACTLQGNTLKNMNYTSVEDNPWDGIFINTGDVNVTENIIGATTGTGSVKITTPVPAAIATISGGVVNSTITIVGGGSGYTTPPLVTFSLSGSTTPATATANLTGDAVTSITVTYGGIGYTSVPSVVFDGQSNGYSTSHGMINNSVGTVNILNNKIGSITTVGSDTYSHGFESVYNRGATGTTTLSNNLIGSLSTVNSIHTSSLAASSLQKQDVYGLYTASGGTAILSGNTIANLTNAYSGTNGASRTRPIAATSGSNTIQNNTIRNITSASAQNGTMATASIIGISISAATAGTTQTVSGNTIYALTNTHLTASPVIYGIYYSGPASGTNIVSDNFIHSISFSSSNTTCDMEGILFNNGLTTCFNNIINLGDGITTGYKINGIWDESGATNNNNIYFNSVYIGGIVSSANTTSTAALWNKNNTSTRNYRNNILYNARTGGATGKHYSIRIEGMAGVTIDYNDYYSSSGNLGRVGSLDKANLAAWKDGTSQDLSSLSINPVFTNAGGTTAPDYYTSATLPGVSVTDITTDYAANVRAVTPKMGALEVNSFIWQGGTSTDFGTAANWTGSAVPPDGADITFATAPTNNCYLDLNRIVGNITNAQSAKKLIVNGKSLTINGSLNFTNSAQIDATSTSSIVVFSGSAAQSIPSGSFVSNAVDALTINNSNGLTLNGTTGLTVPGTLTLTSGTFTIGANTLTINGAITTTSGTLTGGSSTNIIIGGSGAASMPAIVLNNLTVNRSPGISLAGSVSVSGTLFLTAGTIVVGANTLTISGSSPTRTSGSIDASNANASLVFANATAITLPASIFTNNVNNFSLTGIGGITSSSDFSIAGILNLQNPNPSATKGLLDMGAYALAMGAAATTTGAGDVTGIVTRTSFVINTPYSFGNEFTTINMAAGGTLPGTMSVKIVLTNANLSWMPVAIHRYYDIIQTGGDSNTKVTTNLHYLDAELNDATEGNLDLFDYHIISNPAHLDDHGRSNDNIADNWVGLANMSLTYIAKGTTFDVKYWTLGTSTAANFTWLGAAGSTWESTANWVGGVVPGAGNHVVIPDATTTPSDPELPVTATIGYLLIQSGGILNGGTGTSLTVDGGYFEGGGSASWDNGGTFNAETSTVIFTNAKATMSDPTNFYNVTVANGANLSLGTDNIMRIAGVLSLSATGVLNAANTNNTIEFNGIDQTIINPNGFTPGYYNLILSGSGTKTLPATALSIAGDFTTSGTATATAGSSMAIGGELTIAEGSTFATGAYNHTVGGAFDNSGTFTASAGYAVTLNGSSAQSVYGTSTTTFDKLTIDNSNGVSLLTNVNVNNVLTLTAGNLDVGATTLGLNGTISKTAGYIEVDPTSSLTFGGTGAIALNDDLFLATPSINNLTISRSGGVALGNQSMTVNGLLNLSSGTLTVGANTLTIAGSSPTRSSGTIDASNASATLAFTNTTAIILPASFFTGNVNNLTINGTGGITAGSDFTVAGILNLQSENPLATKGSLDMLDVSTIKTLTMGALATTVGVGDVTGIVTRTTINPEVTYTFGNEFTSAYFPSTGTLPTQMSAKISIGTVPSWQTGAIAREIEIIQTGGSGTKAILSFHYLDSELNGNDEEHLVLWVGPTPNAEYGRSAYNPTDNWIALSNINVDNYFTSSWDPNNNITLDEYGTASTLTWNGSVSDSWTTPTNWTPNAGPSSEKNIIIPDASTTLHSPTLPSLTEIKTLTIDPAGTLNSEVGAQLTINWGSSAWNNNGGTFNPSTSRVIFTGVDATISGTTNFYDVTTTAGKVLWLISGSTMRIAGTMTNNGTWRTVIDGPTTVEYNGASQTVVVPNPATNRYSTLILSGSGTKTMPVTALAVYGDFSTSGTAVANAGESIHTTGNFTIGSGSGFVTGAFTHSIGGNFTNNGTFTGTDGGTMLFDGTTAQSIGGTSATTFAKLTIDNATGVTLASDALTTVYEILAINLGKKLEIASGKKLTVSGILTNSAGISGLVLKSDETGSSSLISSSTDVSATVERWMTGSKWHLISSPVVGQAISESFFTANSLDHFTGAGSIVYYGLADYNEPSNTWNGFFTTSASGSFTSGKGFEIRRNASGIVSFTGATVGPLPKSYSLSRTSTTTQGWNCIGNPFTSALAINSRATEATENFLTKNYGSLDESFAAVYVWIEEPAYTYAGSSTCYRALTNADYNYGSYYSPYGGTSVNYLQVGQGFFVRSKSGGGSISFTSAMQSHQDTVSFKSSNTSWPGIHLIAAKKDAESFTDVTFYQNMTKGLDPTYDAGLMRANSDFVLYTRLIEDNGVDFCLQCLPDDEYDRLMIPIGLDCKVGGSVTFSAKLVSLPANCKPYLEDRQTGIITDFSVEKANYAATVSADTKGVGRFYLYTYNPGTPVEEELNLLIYSVGKEIHIEGSVEKNTTASLYDITGKVLISYSLPSSTVNILHPVGVAGGVYVLVVQEGEKRIAKKLLLNK